MTFLRRHWKFAVGLIFGAAMYVACIVMIADLMLKVGIGAPAS